MEKIEKKENSFLFFLKAGVLMIIMVIVGLLAGVICGLFGTGGGMILVPAFVYMLKIEPKRARATSLCCIFLFKFVRNK